MHRGQPRHISNRHLCRDYRATSENMPARVAIVSACCRPRTRPGNYVKVVQRLPVRIRFEPGPGSRASAASRHVSRATVGCDSLSAVVPPSAWAKPAAAARTIQSVGDCADRHDGDVYGVARHQHLECLPTAHRRRDSVPSVTTRAHGLLTSYLVANAVIPADEAWLSRGYSDARRYYMMCVALFTVTSFLCGIAPSLGMLISFRVLQGVGGGGLAPVEQRHPGRILFPRKNSGSAFALYSMAIVDRRRPSVRSSALADGLPIASRGVGFSSSTFRSACSR